MKAFTPRVRALVVVGTFLVGCLSIFVYLLTGTSLTIPLIEEERDYTAVVKVKDTDNLVAAGQVRIAGVQVGEVREIILGGGRATVVMALDAEVAPLHEGATVRMGERSVVGETYLDVRDGTGPAIPSGTTLPGSAVEPSVQLRDVLASMDPETRQATREMIRSMGAGTVGTQQDVAATMAGLGHLGREGHTALDAIAAQSEDLRALARETTTLLRALDTGEGQLATMVDNAGRLTDATSGQRQAIENTMRQLPGVLDSANVAAGELTEMSGQLAPVAANLNEAAPSLDGALRQLPETTRDLRGLLPPLRGTLNRAPETLQRVPTFGADARGLVPTARTALQDVNPMLAYLKPYGPELAAFIVNFNASLRYTDEAGVHYIRLFPTVNDASVQSPVAAGGATVDKNPYPAAGSGAHPGPFTGSYPRVERAPR